MKDAQKGFFETIGMTVVGLPFAAVLGLPFVFYHGLIFQCLWAWFVSPVFGIHTLSFGAATGIVLVNSALKHCVAIKEEYKPSYAYQFADLVFSPTVVLMFGWIVKNWIGV